MEYQEYEPFCGASKYGKVRSSATQRTIPKGVDAASFQNLGAYFAEMLVMDDFLLLTSADGVLPGGIDSINYQLPKSANHQDRLV